jgi:hypothetical protein
MDSMAMDGVLAGQQWTMQRRLNGDGRWMAMDGN